MKKRLSLLLALMMALLCVFSCLAEDAPAGPAAADGEETEYAFESWNPEAPALAALIGYLDAVTDETSPDYIPPEARIAVFDMDGTLYGELFPTYLEYYMLAWRLLKDPDYTPSEEDLALGRELRESVLTGSFTSDFPLRHAFAAARAYAGMTQEEFADWTTRILLRDVDGFDGMTYGNAFFQPMIEVVEYLQDCGFTVYVVSGSDRFICRTLLEGAFDIPYSQIIGMDVAMVADNQGDADGLDYVFQPGDRLVRSDRLLIKNLKMNKVSQIARDIGRQPVLSFGNSSGDVSMHNYVISGNPYRAEAFMLIADDEERDYGDAGKAEALREKWVESGYHVISMKDDFKTIYGEEAVKTGVFRWAEELADESAVPADAEPADEGVQYMLYVGTNDQYTNEPVFPPEECLERAKRILIANLGGYTISEASGGWVGDDGTEYQEYTLVIFISGSTEEEVYHVAELLRQELNQSAIMIQAIPIRTEYFTGD